MTDLAGRMVKPGVEAPVEDKTGADAGAEENTDEGFGFGAEFDDMQRALGLAFSITRNSQPLNMFGQCGTSHPIHHLSSALPVGLQIAGAPNHEVRLLAIARAVEQVLGLPPAPDLTGFL